MGAVFLARYFLRAADPLNALTVNIINFSFLMVGVLLHRTPARLMHAVQAAHELKVHLGWSVASYDLGEALANLLQPFWMLPTLGIFGLRARDVMGYTFIVFLALAPLVILLVTLLGATLPYPL